VNKINPCLWFDNQAEDAMNFYVATFRNSKLGAIARYGDAGPGPKGSVMTVTATLDGQEFMALNGGPHFKISPAISFIVNCETQAEVDDMWAKLSAGGAEQQCGWLTDKFGVSWQIVPTALGEMMKSGTGEQRERVMTAVLAMIKLDIATLKAAFDGK
jgi:predicted 3-demethylubiquinone-9 3-methyltransferase (glyoxalase superfamily)